MIPHHAERAHDALAGQVEGGGDEGGLHAEGSGGRSGARKSAVCRDHQNVQRRRSGAERLPQRRTLRRVRHRVRWRLGPA